MRAGLDILAVGAHPDDVELGCGGTLGRAAREGKRVGILDLTAGEMATRGDSHTRELEAKLAARVLGVEERTCLGLADTELWLAGKEGLDRLVTELRRLRPRVLLIPYQEARHPDHGDASRLAERAAFLAGVRRYQPGLPPHRPGTVAYYMERYPFEPTLVVDISDDFARKMKAIKAYASQFAVAKGQAAGPRTFIARREFLESIEVRERYFGLRAGVSYAEPFLVRGLLSVGPEALIRSARPVS